MARNLFQKFYHKDLQKVYRKFNGIILDDVIGDISDLQNYFEDLSKKTSPNTKVLISYHNDIWEPILTFASKISLRKNVGVQNWLDEYDLKNILNLSGYEVISTQRRMLLPLYIPLISTIINNYFANLPVINNFCLTIITIAKPRQIIQPKRTEYSVSIIIPARNEEGNIAKIISRISKFGKWQEIIFIEGHSKDKTWGEIIKVEQKKHPKYIKIKAFKQKGVGKANAVRLGLSKATGDILMIYDADRTVDAKDLPKFYNVLASGIGEFANGSRLIYPMETQAMQTLNKIGNQIFSWLFTWILGQHFKDTLCGTKAFFRKDYLKFKHSKTDPFGDFDLIFGAIRNNLKVVEIPVRYKERVYGTTNINRFLHGLMLLKMAVKAFAEFKVQ